MLFFALGLLLSRHHVTMSSITSWELLKFIKVQEVTTWSTCSVYTLLLLYLFSIHGRSSPYSKKFTSTYFLWLIDNPRYSYDLSSFVYRSIFLYNLSLPYLFLFWILVEVLTRMHLLFVGYLNFPDKPFACNRCGRRYKWKTSLQCHQRDECGKEPQYKCYYCAYKTKIRSNWVRHEKTHTNPRGRRQSVHSDNVITI